MNFALTLAQNRYPGVQVDLQSMVGGADPSRPTDLVERVLAAVLHGHVTPATRTALATQLDTTPTRSPERLTALVLGSPEFQRR